ncbi:MAG: alpha/beta fold hydrolase [Alphaproteobacteria bacterium]|nr:alpha/beta fold hydrolase [Alphaproteobacteria bacterium]
MSISSDDSKVNFFDLFPFAVLNPQIAMLSYLKVGEKMARQPKKMEEAQQNLLDRLVDLQKNFIKEICKDEQDQDCIELEYNKEHKKFEENPFENHPIMKFSKKFHETVADWLMTTLSNVDDVDSKTMHSARFFLKQYIDMMAPKNFPFLNADFLQKTIDTYGENIRNGMEMLMKDIQNGTITTNDRSKFNIGENIAITPGKVIYQNDLIELIQYSPTTEKVYEKPFLFVPPWINKFYILDLTPEMSFVKWLVDKGFTVFMISWVNPDKRHRNKGFGDYIIEGLIDSIDKIHEITKSKSIHTLGYCVGGTLISTLLAYLAHPNCKRHPKANIDSATLLTTLLDFNQAGDMAIFMAGNYLDAIDAQLKDRGYLDGQIMFNTFSSLKANDMIWRYFVDSYMLGKKPIAHEILFWNSDPTNLTESMQKFLSKELYRDNLLKTGTLEVLGVPINLKLITTPIYMISMEKDHLVPWKAAFDGMKLFNSSIRFVLGGSGHVAGAINPPQRNKYCYWVNEGTVETAADWFETATKIAGSWWNDWLEWLTPMMGKMIAPQPITNFLRDAPGIYVKNQIEDKKIDNNLTKNKNVKDEKTANKKKTNKK